MLPWQLPSRDRKTYYRLTIYGRISADSANLAKIDAVDFDTISLAEIVKTNKKIRNRDRTYSAHRAFQAERAEKKCVL